MSEKKTGVPDTTATELTFHLQSTIVTSHKKSCFNWYFDIYHLQLHTFLGIKFTI